MKNYKIFTLLIAVVLAFAGIGFAYAPPIDLNGDFVSKKDVSTPSVDASITVFSPTEQVELRGSPIPATAFAFGRFTEKDSLYKSRSIEVETPPNIRDPEAARKVSQPTTYGFSGTANSRAREKV